MSVEPWTLLSPLQGVDAAPGDPHVPQQLLQDGVAADDLDPGGVLGAAHGVEQRAGLARGAGGAEGGRHGQELLLGTPVTSATSSGVYRA